VNRYPVAIVPTNDFFADLDWIYAATALPGEGDEITVTAVENLADEPFEESAVVLVSSIGKGEPVPITAAPL
jgi:hypothetical protein